jgi:hypothetical protein
MEVRQSCTHACVLVELCRVVESLIAENLQTHRDGAPLPGFHAGRSDLDRNARTRDGTAETKATADAGHARH